VKIKWSEPGIPLSAAIHGGLFLATLIAFSSTTKFEEQPESIAVEMVTSSELSQMTKGDKTVKVVKPDAKIKADKVAEEELIKQESADAKKRHSVASRQAAGAATGTGTKARSKTRTHAAACSNATRAGAQARSCADRSEAGWAKASPAAQARAKAATAESGG
jgi:colicin import membrane protein